MTTLELMIERDLLITEAVRLTFVAHHRVYCSIDNANCPEQLSPNWGDIGGRFIAGVLGSRLALSPEIIANDGWIEHSVTQAASNLRIGLTRMYQSGGSPSGQIAAGTSEADAVLRAALVNVSVARDHDAAVLLRMFRTAEEMIGEWERILPGFGGFVWT